MKPSERCEAWLRESTGATAAFLTPSATSALEMAVMLLGIGPGDEVIMPSFGFSSDANAVILRGGIPVFCDIELETLNLNWIEVGKALSPKTKAILPVHYAGVTGNASLDGYKVIEDAAQCIGDFKLTGDFSCISFHETKNVSCGQGGALLIRDTEMIEKAQILRHCGTTKAAVKHAWEWVDVGTQQLMSEVLAEYLLGELSRCDEITRRRQEVWNVYWNHINAKHHAQLPGNGHIFWFLHAERGRIQKALAERGLRLSTHYTPLHEGPGRKYGRCVGDCANSVRVSNEILRPPMNVRPDEAYLIAMEINKEL